MYKSKLFSNQSRNAFWKLWIFYWKKWITKRFQTQVSYSVQPFAITLVSHSLIVTVPNLKFTNHITFITYLKIFLIFSSFTLDWFWTIRKSFSFQPWDRLKWGAIMWMAKRFLLIKRSLPCQFWAYTLSSNICLYFLFKKIILRKWLLN